MADVYITWRDNGRILREKCKVEALGYIRSHIGWELLIADEDVNVRKGDVTRVKIKEITLPPSTVVVPLSIMRNAYGTILDVIQIGKPSRVEDEKKIQEAVFLAVEDGRIEKGDLIGVINVYYVGVTEVKSVVGMKEAEDVTIVYRSGDGIIRRKVTVEPFGYKRDSVARWEVLVASENKKLRYGEPVIVRVKNVTVPPNTIVYPLHIMRHAYGTMDILCDDKPWKVEEGGEIRKVVFLPVMDGEIKDGELLGVLNFYNIELGAIGRVKQWLDGWLTEMGKTFAEPDWPVW